MNFLVTGATGFIGRELVSAILARGDGVCYLGRQRSRSMDSRAAFFCWNSEEPPPLNTVPRVDAIIHLAGEPIAQRWTTAARMRIESSRVDGTRRLVEAIRSLKHKPGVLVSASAVGYYGERGDELLTETSTPGSDFLAQVCVSWEREALGARSEGVRVVPVRIATVLGRSGGALAKMLPLFRLGLGAKLGSGHQWISWIHIEDLVRMLLFAASDPKLDGPLNGSSPNPVRNANFTRLLASALHRPALLTAPRFALRVVLGEMSDVLFQSLRVLPAAAMQAGFVFSRPALDEALKSLLH